MQFRPTGKTPGPGGIFGAPGALSSVPILGTVSSAFRDASSKIWRCGRVVLGGEGPKQFHGLRGCDEHNSREARGLLPTPYEHIGLYCIALLHPRTTRTINNTGYIYLNKYKRVDFLFYKPMPLQKAYTCIHTYILNGRPSPALYPRVRV